MASILNATTSSGLVTSADNSGSLQLQTNNGTTAVTIDTSQKVGIGTASPTGKLDVSSSSAGVTAGDLVVDTANKTVYVGRQSSTSGDNSYLVVRGRVNGSGTNQAIAITGDTTAYGTGLFRPNNDMLGFSTLATERMRIDSSGSLLVGTSTNTTNGGFIFSPNFYGTGRSTQVIGHINGASSGDAYIVFNYNGTGIGSITQNGTTATAYNTSSDYRLKENIAPMTGALATVSQLKPVTYKWKADGSSGQGFIAHELQAVVPDCVTGEKDAVETVDDVDADGKVIGTKEVPKYQGVDTSFLVATLTAAIQELKAQLDESNLILTSVKTELDATKAEVQALKGTL